MKKRKKLHRTMLLNYSYSQRIHSAMALWVLIPSKLPKLEYDFFEVPDCKSFYDHCLFSACVLLRANGFCGVKNNAVADQ